MSFNEARAQLILALRQQGIRDARVLEVMETTPREKFVSPEFADKAWDNQALPIPFGQTISFSYQFICISVGCNTTSVVVRDLVCERSSTISGMPSRVKSPINIG